VAARARRFPDLDLRPLKTGPLDRREAALAHAIDHAVARRWLTLAAVLQTQVSRRWDRLQPEVQAALLVGAGQLLLLERLPDYAVIDEAVEWSKTKARPKAGGLVNAVLRRVASLRDRREPARLREGDSSPFARNELPLSDGQGWRLNAPVFDEDPHRRLGQQTSHPHELLLRWSKRFGPERAVQLAVHNLVHPPIIVAGLAREPAGAPAAGGDGPLTVEARLPPGCGPHEEGGFAVFGGDKAALEALLAEHPGLRVQDPAAAVAVAATAPLGPDLIVEVCAGRGTKTRQLAGLHPRARIIATDANRSKLSTLRQAFKGHDRVQVIEHGQLLRYAGQAQLVVVDVPCTNTGVLARRVEAKYRFDDRNLTQLVSLQRQIIADSIRLLADTGHLLYSTCSLEAEENEGQTEWTARWHRLRICQGGTRLPRGAPGGPPGRYADGGYFAVLERAPGER
jgi:16S rRNA (cytosine967-C5)-methyltransferase